MYLILLCVKKGGISTIFKFFGMTRPGIEHRSPGSLANTELIRPLIRLTYKVDLYYEWQSCKYVNQNIEFSKKTKNWPCVTSSACHKSCRNREKSCIKRLQLFVGYLLFFLWRCLWCNGYCRRKWTRQHEFKSWTRLIAFHIALIPLGKVWIQLFSLQLWLNSRTD